jgi:ATP-dependent RNA helicase SUPV3L1/SUV3
MKKIEAIYPEAVERTKEKIHDDLIDYLATKENIPTLENYLIDRNHYLDQIWINIWMNKASNQIPRIEKKQFLHAKGYEVEGIDKKVVTKLFRQEIKLYQPYPIEEWLLQTYSSQDKWLELYQKARADYLKWLEIEESDKAINEIIDDLREEMVGIMSEYHHLFYLQIRKIVADHLKQDMETKTKYQEIEPFQIEERLIPQGFFDPKDYRLVKDFFAEVTGEIQRNHHDHMYKYTYETYEDVYQDFIFQKAVKIITEKGVELLYPKYRESFEDNLLGEVLQDLVIDESDLLMEQLYSSIFDESPIDLIKLSQVPFDEEIHAQIFMEDVKLREKRKAEERAEIQRNKEREARIIEDIFYQEYNPPSGRNIHYTLHIGETNTGKTYHALQKMMAAKSGIYLAPLRLLALEVYDFLNEYGTYCSLKTGEEEKLNPEAKHISCTVEMFHEKDFYEVAVIDEAQMISDKDRGFSWFKAITKVNAKEVHIIASRNAKDMLLKLLGNSEIEIHDYKREIPLKVEKKPFKINQVKKGDALICFSRKRVLETASRLQNNGHSVSMIYGSMPPETRKKQVERFIQGESKVIVATDAIGMGLNLPIQRIVFLENRKFDGTSRRLLTSQEIKQIAGRAGRKGIYDIGKVAFVEDISMMKDRLQQEDVPIQTFTIAPTSHVFEKFQKHDRDLGHFFDIWDRFKSPKGTRKASLAEEKELYQLIRGTEMEVRLPLMDLYGLLHLPFSTREPELIKQWKNTVEAIVTKKELPEPKIKKRSLEDLELSYKTIGLHLLFLYRLNEKTKSLYWERLRLEISDMVHEKLKTDVKKMRKRCRKCNQVLPWDHRYQICESCYEQRYINYYDY